MSELRDEVEALRKKMADRAYESGKAEAGSFSGRTRQHVTSFHRFIAQVAAAIGWILSSVLSPILRVLFKPLAWLWRIYRYLWDKAVHYEDAYRNRQFSKSRAGLFLAASAVFAWFIFIPAIVFVYDAALYFATVKRGEVVYLTNSQEIFPEENEHSVQGCHQLPCTDQNSLYFRIRASYFNEAWSILSGRGLFFPDYVAASVPVAVSRCRITSYGLRIKLLMRGFDVFPDLLQTECTPLTETPE